MALTDGLISYWKCDDASGNALDAHSTNDLTAINAPGSTTGKLNGGRDLESTSAQAFTHTDNSDFSLGADVDFTWSLWFKNETNSATGNLIIKIASPYGNENIEYRIDTDGGGSGRSLFRVGNGSSSQLVSSNTFTYQDGVWFFLVAWHDSAADKIYIQINNDTPAEAAWSGGTQDTSADFYMGGQSGITTSFDGVIDEILFAKRVYTADERTTLYGGGTPPAYPFGAVSVARPDYYYRSMRVA